MKFFVAAFLLVSCCLVEADAQTRKKRTRRTRKPAAAKPVITNPPIVPATETATGDVKIISTADQPTQSPEASASPAKKAQTDESESADDMKKTITTLSNQVNRLNDKLSSMQEDDRYQLDMERLSRAEQRSEQLRSQMLDTESKIADIESKLEQIEYAIKPENIDRATQGYGSTRPEEARETRRRQLENERSRLQAQLKILETSKSRLAVATANADQEVDLLRAKLQQRRDQMDAEPAKERPAPARKPRPDF
jgi:DNA repair exonuclease SbcCD ATPase subunit